MVNLLVSLKREVLGNPEEHRTENVLIVGITKNVSKRTVHLQIH